MDISELDNPAWVALTGRHAHLAIGEGPVQRYPAEVSPFAALETPSALPALAERMAEGETAVLWSPAELKRLRASNWSYTFRSSRWRLSTSRPPK